MEDAWLSMMIGYNDALDRNLLYGRNRAIKINWI